MVLTPEAFGQMTRTVHAERAATGRTGPFDVAVFGLSEPAQPDTVQAFGDAGATWWLESLSLMRGPAERLLEIIEAGPPPR